MNIFKEAINQLLPQSPKDTKIIFTKNAREGMGGWGLTEERVRSVVLQGKKVRENMISQKFNGYSIGCIAKYDRVNKEYLVLSVWKKQW